MRGFVGRRRQQQFASLFGMMCLALCACTDGRGTPLVFAEGSEAGTSGTGASSAGHSGTHAIDASVDTDDEPPQTSECRRYFESSWSTSYAADEAKLLEELNELRANPTPLCPQPLLLPSTLESVAALRCASRMRAREENNYAKPGGGSPGFSALYFPDQRSQEQAGARDREKRAGSTRIDAEIIVYNVSSASGVLGAIEASSGELGSFCGLATNLAFPFVGIGRYGNVWVIDLSRGFFSPTRPPTSGMGSSGPGNSGTAGR